ncbi:MAG: RIP metalloprotease RseP [Dehalococcoidia bacterium]|nr:RIP metalloprotease RseP [Dehalococcoidia bacterium]
MSVAIIIILFLVTLFVAICLHELGHFIAAKRAGVKVEEFGIGFPPPRLFGIKRGETIYSVNAIPVGAFVKAAGENDPTVPRSLAGKGPWTRLGIYAAGPLVNIFLAFVLLSAFLALPVGTVVSNGLIVRAVVGNSSAEEADIKPGDIILEVDGQPVHTQGDVHNAVNSIEEGAEISLLLLRNGQKIQTTVKPKFDPESKQLKIGAYLWWDMVSQVDEGSPAYEAGIRPGDAIDSINGHLVYDDESMSRALHSAGEGEKINMVLVQDGKTVSISLTNDGYETLPGVEMRWVDGTHIKQERLPVWRAVYLGARSIIYMPVLMIEAIPQIIKSPDMALVGPIGAGQLTVEMVRSSGLSSILFMASMISIGLGIFNFFPIPPLDGGGMLVAFIEGCRRGKRLSPRAVRLAYTIGTTFLITLVILVTILDIWRIWSGRGFGL